MRSASLLILIFLLCTSFAVPQRHPNLRDDSITFISALTETGEPIRRGGPIPIVVTLAYTLASHDTAILSLSTAQFRDPDHCNGGGELINAEQRVVQRGSGVLTIHITWSGDTGEASKDRIYGKGSLSFSAMFWKEVQGGRGPAGQWERYDIFPFYGDYCVHF